MVAGFRALGLEPSLVSSSTLTSAVILSLGKRKRALAKKVASNGAMAEVSISWSVKGFNLRPVRLRGRFQIALAHISTAHWFVVAPH